MLSFSTTTLAARFTKFTALGALVLASACSGAGTSGTSPVPNTQFCGADTQYLLARPLSGQSVQANSSVVVEIVAAGNNNQIAQSYRNFDLLFVPASNNNGSLQGSASTGSLSITSDKGGYAPFSSDYYYNGTVTSPGLAPQTLYNVYVNAFTSNCVPVGPIGQLGTP
jgi:hypothetical protein